MSVPIKFVAPYKRTGSRTYRDRTLREMMKTYQETYEQTDDMQEFYYNLGVYEGLEQGTRLRWKDLARSMNGVKESLAEFRAEEDLDLDMFQYQIRFQEGLWFAYNEVERINREAHKIRQRDNLFIFCYKGCMLELAAISMAVNEEYSLLGEATTNRKQYYVSDDIEDLVAHIPAGDENNNLIFVVADARESIEAKVFEKLEPNAASVYTWIRFHKEIKMNHGVFPAGAILAELEKAFYII